MYGRMDDWQFISLFKNIHDSAIMLMRQRDLEYLKLFLESVSFKECL